MLPSPSLFTRTRTTSCTVCRRPRRRLMDYASLFSASSRARKPSAIRALQPLVNLPGMISLGGGMPNPATFPISGLSFALKNGPLLTLSHSELHAALQYSPTPGLPHLTALLKDFQLTRHHVTSAAVRAATSVAVTTGSQDALAKAFSMLLDPDSSLLLEYPTYSGSLAYLQPMGVHLVGFGTDKDGLRPAELADTLQRWDELHPGKKRPRCLYTIPTGANPSGSTLTLARKQAIYALAQAHDLLILEDDPYYFLQYGAPVRSFLSLDVDGRALRFDSFSKILSSGLRVGFATGPAALLDRLNLHTQASNLHPCGLSQAVVLKLLQHWGPAQFDAHVASICRFYEQQCAAFLASADRHLCGLAEWSHPRAGMFVWIKLLGVCDSFELITKYAVSKKILLVPGTAFMPNGEPSQFVRAAFSTATPEEMDTALARLADLLREQAGPHT